MLKALPKLDSALLYCRNREDSVDVNAVTVWSVNLNHLTSVGVLVFCFFQIQSVSQY